MKNEKNARIARFRENHHSITDKIKPDKQSAT